MKKQIVVLLLFWILLVSTNVFAVRSNKDCFDDCKEAYDNFVDTCNETATSDEDLSNCLDSALQCYHDCISSCPFPNELPWMDRQPY